MLQQGAGQQHARTCTGCIHSRRVRGWPTAGAGQSVPDGPADGMRPAAQSTAPLPARCCSAARGGLPADDADLRRQLDHGCHRVRAACSLWSAVCEVSHQGAKHALRGSWEHSVSTDARGTPGTEHLWWDPQQRFPFRRALAVCRWQSTSTPRMWLTCGRLAPSKHASMAAGRSRSTLQLAQAQRSLCSTRLCPRWLSQ